MNKRDKQTGFALLYPGRNYLGPGNKFPNGEPQSEADKIAYEHDYLYSVAKTIDDIKKADEIAINKFKQVNAYDAIAGYVGLKAKSIFESKFGHVYPKMSDDWRKNIRKDGKNWNAGNKAYADRQKEKSKRRKLNEENSTIERPSTSAQAHTTTTTTESSDSEALADLFRDQIESPIQQQNISTSMDIDVSQPVGGSNRNESTSAVNTGVPITINLVKELGALKSRVLYKKEFVFTTWANAYTPLVPQINSKAAENMRLIATPLAVIPLNMLCVYMSKAQFDNLPNNSKAIASACKVTPIGYKVSFATGQSTSMMANSAHSIFGVSSIGLNNTLVGTHRKLNERDATNPMIATNYTLCTFNDIEERLWGTKTTMTSTSIANDDIPFIAGPHRHCPCYWLTYHNKTLIGYQNLREEITEFDLMGAMNQPVIDYFHKFSNGYLKNTGLIFPDEVDVDEKKTTQNYGPYNLRYRGPQFKMSIVTDRKGGVNKIDLAASIKNLKPRSSYSYQQEIEKYDMSSVYQDSTRNAKRIQPLVYFGVQPILANSPGSTTDYTNCQAIWKIETSLEVDIDLSTEYAYTNKRSLRHFGQLSSDTKTAEESLSELTLLDLYIE